jgi:addiction module HigA family antidote
MTKTLKPTHPGIILLEEFLEPLGITQYRPAKQIDVPQHRIYELAKGKRAITLDTAIRLGHFFATSARFWLNLQTDYDLRNAQQLRNSLEKQIEPWLAAEV